MKLGTGESATPSVTDCLVEHDVSLADALSAEPDLEAVKVAMIREYAIRHAMAETGEDRETVSDMIGAMESMDQEAVLELTSGAPTTLADGLQAYIDRLDIEALAISPEVLASDLHALLMYPWPEEEATIATHGANASVALRVEQDDQELAVSVGGQKVATFQDLGDGDARLIEGTAEEVHRAVLARVIGDREHIVQLSPVDAKRLSDWLGRPYRSGSWLSRHDASGASERITINAVEGGGILIRTRPFTYVTPPQARG